MKRIATATLCFMLCALQSWADDTALKPRALLAAGMYDTDEERRTVEVDDCMMTAYRWRNTEDHGWVLWTSFRFDMRFTSLVETPAGSGTHFTYVTTDEGPPETGFGLIGFKTADGTTARQERSILREPSGETLPSPRGDGTTHYYQELTDFIVTMEGVGVFEKVRDFSVLYRAYVETQCVTLS